MMKDEDVWKAVKVAYDKTANQHYPKKAGDKISSNKERIANGDDVALIFSAYAVGGSKEHFHNILTENKLFEKNLTKQNNTKEEVETNKTLTSLKTKNEELKTNSDNIQKAKDEINNEKDKEQKTKKEENLKKIESEYPAIVLKNLSGIFSQDRNDLPENNSKSEYAQLASNSKNYPALYDSKNINIFLSAFQESLKDATNATLANTIDASKLSNAISYMKDGKATVTLDK